MRLLSDVFLFWNRFLTAWLVVSIAFESKPHRCLRCKNVTKCDIMIKRIRTIPKTVFVARDHSLIAITDGLIGIPFTALIPPNATHDFPLIVKRAELFDDNAPRSRIHDHYQLVQHPLDMAAPMAGFHLVVYADLARSRQGIEYTGRPEVGRPMPRHRSISAMCFGLAAERLKRKRRPAQRR
jgi:hypothetical protein